MRALLKRVWSAKGNGPARYHGVALGMPREGEPFQIAALLDGEPNSSAVITTPVVHTRELAPRLHRFYTENSVYELEVLEPAKEVANG